MRINKIFHTGLISIFVLSLGVFFNAVLFDNKTTTPSKPVVTASPTIEIFNTPSLTPKLNPSPTPKPLTFAEMNERYGPCTYLPVLIYHHIQSEAKAVKLQQTNLSVYTNIFEQQLQYLKSKGYSSIQPSDLINFFNTGTKIGAKKILLTFDDGYEDFYTDAYPLLQKFGFSGLLFLPTGLAENPGYLTWTEIAEMAKNGIYFANHTWSHKVMLTSYDKIVNEISIADTQLTDHHINSKIFAYPYGTISSQSETVLKQLGYQAAFSTESGSTLCTKLRLELPRLRAGNFSLTRYGL